MPARTFASSPRRRLIVAVGTSVALVLSAPYVGLIRSAIRSAFPDQFSTVINVLVAAALAAAVLAVLGRIRDRRLFRYAALCAAFGAGVAYAAATGSADPGVRAVEHFHFVEFGLITFLFYRVWRDRLDWSALALPVLAAFIVGVAEEWFQWFLPARVGELRDVWLNFVAVGCGLLFALGVEPPAPFTFGWRNGSTRRVSRAIAAAIIVLAAFVHIVHLGREIDDPDIGAFGSRFSVEQLQAMSADRASRWLTAPPLERPPRMSREDQYMTEGLQHVQARNEAWDRGDVTEAFRENLILERYFAPVLDTPSYVSATGHRWHPDQRADAEVRAGAAPEEPFTSEAYPYPLYYWSPVALWALALSAAAALLLVSRRDSVADGRR